MSIHEFNFPKRFMGVYVFRYVETDIHFADTADEIETWFRTLNNISSLDHCIIIDLGMCDVLSEGIDEYLPAGPEAEAAMNEEKKDNEGFAKALNEVVAEVLPDSKKVKKPDLIVRAEIITEGDEGAGIRPQMVIVSGVLLDTKCFANDSDITLAVGNLRGRLKVTFKEILDEKVTVYFPGYDSKPEDV